MRIVHIVPGSGNTFYCENCLRDLSLIKATRALGHDALLVPLYLPLYGAEEPDASAPIFYGAVSLYFRQKVPFLRRLPLRWMEWLDARAVLKWAARRAGSTRATGLENMTVSMLRGEAGRQAAELRQLTQWLAGEAKPDVVYLSNALLLGLAGALRRTLDVPVVCALQDEDTWVDPMSERFRQRIYALMREDARHVALFASCSDFYAGKMRERIGIPGEKLRTVYPGVAVETYRSSRLPFDPPVIGYLSRMSDALGLDVLIRAFIRLKQRPGLERCRLRITGGETGDDAEFTRRMHAEVKEAGLGTDVEFVEALEEEARTQFLASLSVLSVPVPAGEALGLYQLEAMASGVPVVQPAVGAFPEIVSATGGGVVYEDNSATGLEEALARLLVEPERVRSYGQAGRDAVRRDFTVEAYAERMQAVYDEVRHVVTG